MNARGAPPAGASRLVVLAIDDHADNLTALRAVLTDALPGCTLVTALDGPRGLEQARAADPDVILLDLVMPGMDGFEVCRLLKADEGMSDIPVVFLTALGTDRESRIRALAVGADAFLAKPADESELVAQVRAMAKVRAANRQRRLEREDLSAMVAERTAALRRAAADYRCLADHLPDLVARFDAGLRHVYVNPAAARAGVLSVEQYIGLTVAETGVPAPAAAAFEHLLRRVFATGQPVEIEDEFPTPAGLRYFHTSLVPEPAEDGSIRSVLSLARDVTERRRAEEALERAIRELQESKALIEAVVENVPLMIFLKEAQDLRFVVFNRAGEELLGHDRAELLGRNALDLFPPEQAAHFVAKDREALAGDGVVDIPEEPIATAAKGQRLLHTRKCCIKGSDGVTKYLLGISEDITERKRMETEHEKLEEQLRMSQKMEAIGHLAGGVAHDFNNLLSVILSYTEFATDGVPDGSPVKADLLEVRKAGERAAALTRQLLAFSRKQVLQPVALDLNQVAAGVTTMLRRILGEDIDLVQVLAPDLGLVTADPGQLEQVLMNLVVNARDAMPRGGTLTLETANVELDQAYAAAHVGVAPGPYVRLTVTDTGSGMDAATRARLFEPFFTTKEKGKGTGLGLSTVYGIVRQSGGHVAVSSEPGQGSSFQIHLPRDLTAAAAAAVGPPAHPLRATGAETVLVAEDEPALRKVVQRALEEAGYAVLTAEDGKAALQASAQHAGDLHLLLTDVVMPRMGGRALALELTKERPGLKVLYMSGYTDDAIGHHGVLDPGTHLLGKPFSSAALTRKVREVLDGA